MALMPALHCAVRASATPAVALALLALLAGQSAAAAPAPPATSAAPGGTLPDIVGLRPGISAQQAYDFLKAYDKAARIYISDTPLGIPPISPKPFPYRLALTQDPNSNAEVISVSLTLPPSKAVVWRVTRSNYFVAGQAPTVEKVIESLRAKYGPEANLVLNPNLAANARLTWYFDENGKRVAEPGGLSAASCTRQLGPTDETLGATEDHTPAYLLLRPLDERQGVSECRSVIVVSAQLAPLPSNPVNFRITGRLHVVIADLPLEARAHAATLALIAKGAAAEAQQQQQQEDKVAAPKL